MFSLRPAARLLFASSKASTVSARSRTFVTLTPAILRQINQPRHFTRFSVVARRWNSNAPENFRETEVKTEGDAVESAIKSTATDQVGDGAQGTVVEEGLGTEEAEVQSEATLSEASASVGESTLAENPLETEQVEPQSASETSESIGESMPAPSHLSREDASAVTDDATPHHLPPFPPKETIYVGNLFFDVTASDLRTKFEQYGMVESTKIITDMRGLSKGFGYVTFDSVAAATRAIEGMNLQVYEGRRIVVYYATTNRPGEATRRTRKPPTNTLFIGNMSHDMTDRDLNDLFTPLRNLVDVRVAVDRDTGKPRGFAHAEFLDIQSAEIALENLKNKAPYGRKLRLDFSTSNKRAPRVEQ